MYITVNSFKSITRLAVGILCIYVAYILTIGMLTFDPFDPSFNNAVSVDKVSNFSGKKGAFIIDPIIQLFGFSEFVIGLICFYWGTIIILRKRLRWWYFRVLSLIMLCTTIPVLFNFIPVPEKYITPVGGGYLGLIINNYLLSFFDQIFIYIAAGIISFILMMAATGIRISSIKKSLKFIGFMIATFMIGVVKIYRVLRGRGRPHLDMEEGRIDSELPIIFDDQIQENIKENSFTKVSTSIRKAKELKIEKNKKLASTQFKLPSVELLNKSNQTQVKVNPAFLKQQVTELEQVLIDFGIKGNIIDVKPGPVVTLFELEPAAGTKSSRIMGLADDIARSMSALSARIAVIPGKNLIGIELPNKTRETVILRELLESNFYSETEVNLPIVLGKNIGGEPVVVDLAKMPHLLVAGTTGSGKSVAINTMILSLLYKLTPEECKFIMIDPKMLELSVYDGIPHLLAPVVTEPSKAVVALKWVVKEMENRYRMMSSLGVRNIGGFNEKILEANQEGKNVVRKIQTGFDSETGKPIFEMQEIDSKPLPFIVVIVDEMADLMLVAGKEIEASIQRLAQMARAAGIHIIMATQRPSVDVITGVIKANFPTRISFQVTSKIDSRTILGEQGAEQLLGMGDMLYMAGGGKITRVHGPFVSDKEVEKVVNMLKSQAEPIYIEDITASDEESSTGGFESDSGDKLYDEAVRIVLQDQKASTSYIQRCLKIGYNRAASIIERMEKEGIISAANHVGKREILLK